MAIYKYKKDGKTLYRIKVFLGYDPVTGKEIRPQKSGFLTHKAAAIAEERIKKDNNILFNEELTYKQVYDRWLKDYRPSVKPTTVNRTKQHFENAILPYFSDVKIINVEKEHCVIFVNKMLEKYPSKYKEISRYASKIFQYSIDDLHIIEFNPFDSVIFPKDNKPKKKKKKVIVANEELNRILKAMKEDFNTKWFTFFMTLAFTGLRRGEIIALKWSDIDIANQTITIDKTLTRDENGKEYIGNSPKTSTSYRDIIIYDFLFEQLKLWKKEQSKNLSSINLDQLIFPNESGRHLNGGTPLKKLNKFFANHKEFTRMTNHDFRHNFATMLRTANYDYKSIQDMMGHAASEFTLNRYVHENEDTRKELREKMRNVLEI